MLLAVLTFLHVAGATMAIYGLGTQHGRQLEQRAVATVLAKYRNLDGVRWTTVNEILAALHAGYRQEYIKVVDAIDQITIDLKKAGL